MTQRFPRVEKLPPYVFNVLQEMKAKARAAGEDIVDMGMGNPDLATPRHIVEKLKEAIENPRNHRYSVSRGLPKLRQAICDWYQRKFQVTLDSEREAIVTIGAKEGLAHLVLATMEQGDRVLVPSPTYPIHRYAAIIAGAELIEVPLRSGEEFFTTLEEKWRALNPKPRMIIVGFPHNPTTATVDLPFYQRLVDFARENQVYVVQDFAYADLNFDGYQPPSILQAKGAKDVAVELYSLSKGYNMPGWRVGFMCGNADLIAALARMKSYLDYGIFQPIQIASVIALNGPTDCVEQVVEVYRDRRNVLVDALDDAGWEIEKPKATMFVWAKMPEKFRAMGSLEFAKKLLIEGKVVVSPGIGFGAYGDDHVRFALVENNDRIRQAVRGVRKVIR